MRQLVVVENQLIAAVNSKGDATLVCRCGGQSFSCAYLKDMSNSDSQPQPIRYKWDPETFTGYQLRFDAEGAAQGGHYCFHVEDWNCRTVTYEWPCQDLTEALEVLNRLFSVDIEEERARLNAWLLAEYRAAL